MIDIKNRWCRQPWAFTEIHGNGFVYNCCPGWVKKPLGNILEKSWDDIWNGEVAKEYRQNMIDSTFENCIKSNCSQLLSKDLDPDLPVFEKDDLGVLWRGFKKEASSGPLVVAFNYDRSCNLSCPTCRNEMIMDSPNSPNWKNIEKIHKIVTEEVIKDAYRLYITGTGDPFQSPFFRKFLQEFDTKKYPSVGHIHLHTNANSFTPSMWSSMKGVHPFVKSLEISIDAATEETYKITRRGGDWNTLMKNFKFINTIDTIETIIFSFVVQNDNYKEILKLHELKEKFKNKKVKIQYYKVLNWGNQSDDEYDERAVWKESHPNYFEFKKIWDEMLSTTNSLHTLQGKEGHSNDEKVVI